MAFESLMVRGFEAILLQGPGVYYRSLGFITGAWDRLKEIKKEIKKMFFRKKVLPALIALLMVITFIPFTTSTASATDYTRTYLHAYDVTTGQIFTEGIEWFFMQGGSAVKRDNYTFEVSTYYSFIAYLPDDSPYVAVEWREGNPLTGNVVGPASGWNEVRMGLEDEYHYYLILEPKCPKDGGRHEWSQLIKKATRTEDGGIYEKCDKCETENLIAPITAIGSIELEPDATPYTYDGKAKRPGVTVLDANNEAIDPQYYTVTYKNNINAGTAKASVIFNTYYEAEEDLPFTIEPMEIIPSVKVANQVYTGKALEPAVTVKMGDVTLINGTEYTLKYTNNTKVGKASANVTLQGNFSGNKAATFRILPKKAGISSAVPGKKLMKVTMTTKAAATGGSTYEIKYRVKGTSNWKTATTTAKTKTIKNLKKGKQYQVKVRAYKSVSGTKYYGAWSKVKTTKKIK